MAGSGGFAAAVSGVGDGVAGGAVLIGGSAGGDVGAGNGGITGNSPPASPATAAWARAP